MRSSEWMQIVEWSRFVSRQRVRKLDSGTFSRFPFLKMAYSERNVPNFIFSPHQWRKGTEKKSRGKQLTFMMNAWKIVGKVSQFSAIFTNLFGKEWLAECTREKTPFSLSWTYVNLEFTWNIFAHLTHILYIYPRTCDTQWMVLHMYTNIFYVANQSNLQKKAYEYLLSVYRVAQYYFVSSF